MSLIATLESIRAQEVRETLAYIESECGSRFYGLENVTRNGVRKWSLAPRPPRAELAALKGEPRTMPNHIAVKWDAQKHAWRSVDLSTARRAWYTDSRGVRHEYRFL